MWRMNGELYDIKGNSTFYAFNEAPTYAQSPYWKLVANKRFQNPVYNDKVHWVYSKKN